MSDDQLEYPGDGGRELIETIESTPVKHLKSASPDSREAIKRAAGEHVRSEETKMNIRISRGDLERIKEQAAREELKHQSLVKIVLHKYVTGQPVERDKRAG